MPPGPPPLVDRTASLSEERARLEGEIGRLLREEEYLETQLRNAREQVRYYEALIETQRSEWSGRRGVRELLRGLG